MCNKIQISRLNYPYNILNKKNLFLLIFIAFSIISKAQIPTNGLTGYWPFSSSQLANDYSGNNNNGTVHGATLTTDRFGNCNQAYKFNGINNFIEVPNSPTVDMNNTDFTIAVWVKTYATDTIGAILNKNLHTGAWSGYYLTTNDNDPGYCPIYKHTYFYVAAGANDEACSNGPICQDTTWHFLTGVYKYRTNKTYFYVDNVLQSMVGQAAGIISNTTDLFFGGAGDVNEAYFTGVIDAVRIYQRALNANEISQLYNEPNPSLGLGGQTTIVKDTSICTSSTATLSAAPALSYTWSTGSNNQTITINNQGTYWVQIQPQTGCKIIDTIHVNFIAHTTIVKDTSICTSASATLSAVTALSYTWSTGSNYQTISINNQGTYWVQIQPLTGCKIIDTIHVSYINPPTINILKDTSVCTIKNYVLNASQTNATSYVWSTGAVSSSIVTSNVATYWVNMQIGLCLVRDSAQINLLNPPAINLVKDTVMCNDPIILSINDNALHANWSNGSHTNQTTISSVGMYSVSVSDKNGCTNTATVNVKKAEQVTSVTVPNIFTPNGDTHNDVFEFSTNDLAVNEFNIYDRWGKLVYSAQNTPVNWDGKQADDGTYFWTAVFSSPCNNNVQTLKQKGFLTLLK